MNTAGVDVGGTKILGVTLDGVEVRVPTPAGAAILDAIVAVAGRLGPVDGVGVGLAGLVERSGVFRVGPNLPGLVDTPVAGLLSDRLGVAVTVANDATCATWAEHQRGAARGTSDALALTLGTGIGAGIVAGGALQQGAHGFAGEPGHMVVDPGGRLCPCGRRGCWERYASGSGLGWLAREAAVGGQGAALVALAGGDPEAVRGEHVTAAASNGDPEALDVFRRFAWWVALGIANLVNLLDPEVVVVGGGLVEAGDMLLDPVRTAYRDLVMAGDRRPAVPIVPAELGERAGAIGAALLAANVPGQGPRLPR
ncbi:MAG: ROK family protein [Acidimicrobiales bacterium]